MSFFINYVSLFPRHNKLPQVKMKMRTQLTILLLLMTAFSAAAQFPPRTVTHYPAVRPSAEIRFVDGNVGDYPIMRIGKDVMRVEVGGDQSTRMPLTYLESIRFQDGCTLYFDRGELQFDRLVQPARLKNEGGDVVLEGVLPLAGSQTESLMGPDLYRQFRKQSGLVLAGTITLATGTLMLMPYVGKTVTFITTGKDAALINAFKDMSPLGKGVTIGGGTALLAGLAIYIIGNSGCNRVVATYNDGLGLAYTF